MCAIDLCTPYLKAAAQGFVRGENWRGYSLKTGIGANRCFDGAGKHRMPRAVCQAVVTDQP